VVVQKITKYKSHISVCHEMVMSEITSQTKAMHGLRPRDNHTKHSMAQKGPPGKIVANLCEH